MSAAAGLFAKAGLDLGMGYLQAGNIKAQGRLEAAAAEQNAKLADLQADETIQIGERDAMSYADQVNQVIGSQRAAYAGQNVEVNSGSALEVQAQTASQGAKDIIILRNNAFKEAFGYKTEAANLRFGGKIAQASANSSARTTLITSGINAGATASQGYSKLGSSTKTTGVK